MKKLLSIILSLALLFSLVPYAAADEAEAEAVYEASELETVEAYLNGLYRSGKINGGMPSLADMQLFSANKIYPYETMRELARLSGSVQDIDYVLYNYDQSSSLCYYVVIYYGDAESGEATDAWEYPCSDFPIGAVHLGINWNTAVEGHPVGSYTAYSFVAGTSGDYIDIDEESFLSFAIELTDEPRALQGIALVNVDSGERYEPDEEIRIKPNELMMFSVELDPADTTDSRTIRVGCVPAIEHLSAYELGGAVILETADYADGSGTLQVSIGTDKTFSFPVSASFPILEEPKIDFIKQLYSVCLGRNPSLVETTYYLWLLDQKDGTGTEVAYKFLFSKEFSAKNYCDRHFVARLYEAMMGRSAAEKELDNWVWRLQKGASREEIFNEFAASREFRIICTSYRIPVGDAVAIPEKLVRPGGYCPVAGCTEHEGKVAFAARLYNVCLDRAPSQKEIDSWHYYLVHGDYTGISASRFFLFSEEFISKGYGDEDFVKHLYDAMLDRAGRYTREELAYWMWLLSDKGLSREEVFDMFATKDEFSVICQKYGVVA